MVDVDPGILIEYNRDYCIAIIPNCPWLQLVYSLVPILGTLRLDLLQMPLGDQRC